MSWDINEEMSKIGPADFLPEKEPVAAEKPLAKTEFNYQEPNIPPDRSSAVIAPAVRLFAAFVTLGFSEDIHKAVKKTLVATLSSFLTAEHFTKKERQQMFDDFNGKPQATRLTVNVGEKAVLDGMLIKPNSG